ncbi:MAG: hypothetical protein NTX03_01690 [Bacteroidetes bacterium]|nr:hypothetical protein [Bacteroidota bacterium]
MSKANQHNEELIEQYLAGKMTAEARLQFEEMVANDEALQKELEFQRLVVGAMQESRREELINFIKDNIDEDKAMPIYKGRIIWSLSAAACIALLIFFLSEPGTFQEEYQHTKKKILSYNPFIKGEKTEADSVEETTTTKSNSGALADRKEESVSDSILMDGRHINEQITAADGEPDSTLLSYTTTVGGALDKSGKLAEEKPLERKKAESFDGYDGDISQTLTDSENVLSEKMVMDTQVFAIVIPTQVDEMGNNFQQNNEYYSNQKKQTTRSIPGTVDNNTYRGNENDRNRGMAGDTKTKNSPQKDTQKQKSDDANKSDKDKITSLSIKVEFWESPIHFKGYKFFRNKLLLYGVKESEFMKVYSYENNYYLKTAKGVYLLREENIFNSFAPVKNSILLERTK